MAARHLLVLFCFVLPLTFRNVKSDNLLCSEQYCRNYRLEPGCPNVSPHCNFNNATHNGVMVPSPTLCNCCEMCFVFVAEGQECSLGGLGGAALLTSRCGPRLSCQRQHEDSSTCQRMESDCHAEQDEWHEKRLAGELGIMELRPRCDDEGGYAPNKCVSGQTCFCQNKNGTRIFGEALYLDTFIENRMTCSCARIHDEISSGISTVTRWPAIGAKCLPDGSYNPIQCLNDMCYCVNSLTGRPAHLTAINITKEDLGELNCFDPLIHTSNTTYKTMCEEERDNRIIELKQYVEDGFDIPASDILTCEPDGSYLSVRTIANRRICVDGDGEPIGDFGAELNTEGANSMNCKCARTLHVISEAASPTFERPSCCSNGNYRNIQCRQNYCYCVDTDGVQIGREVENINVSDLSCYTETWRQC